MSIFISHSTKDQYLAIGLKDLIRTIYEFNSENDFVISSDVLHSFNAAVEMKLQMQKGIDGSPFFIALISKNYLESPICLMEFGYAFFSGSLLFCISDSIESTEELLTRIPNAVKGSYKFVPMNDINQLEKTIRKDFIEVYPSLINRRKADNGRNHFKAEHQKIFNKNDK